MSLPKHIFQLLFLLFLPFCQVGGGREREMNFPFSRTVEKRGRGREEEASDE